MRKILIIFIGLIYLLFVFPIIGQDKPIKTKQVLCGLGSSQYMNTYFMPSGLSGVNYSLQFNAERSKTVDQKKLSIFSFRTDYSKLQRKNTNTSFDYPTNFYFVSVKKEFLYKVSLAVKELRTHIGFNLGFSGYLNFNKIHNYQNYVIPVYGTWNLNVGFSQMFQYKLRKFTLKNRWNIPLLLFGFFHEYQDFPENFDLAYLLSKTKFVSIFQYADFHNYFSIDYPVLLKGKFQKSLSFTYAYSSHWSEVNYNIARFRKHTFLVGIVFKRK